MTADYQSCFDLPASVRSKIDAFQTASGKRGVIFLGNEASLTGAPMLLLSLVQTFKNDGYECFVLLLRGGSLLGRYEEVATVLLCGGADGGNSPDGNPGGNALLQEFLEAVSPAIKDGKIARMVVANTAEVLKLQAVMKQHGLKVLSLVHELADYYPAGYFNKLYTASNHVIFSSKFSLNSALQKSTRPEKLKLEVKPQGLLPGTNEPADIAASRNQIRTELGVSKDAFVVFACGSITLRKGIDSFIQVARTFQHAAGRGDTLSAECHTLPDENYALATEHRVPATQLHAFAAAREVLFVWIGDSPADDTAPLHFALWDIKQMGLKNVKLLKPRQDLATWFAGADVFLLPSKQDPMPNVAHNALAASIPVVAFAGAGGTEELLQQGGGMLVDYGDVAGMAQAVKKYLLNEDERVSAGLAGQRVAAQNLQFSEYYQHIKQIVEKPVAAEKDAEPITLEQKIEFLKHRLRARLSSKSWLSTQWLRLLKQYFSPGGNGNSLNRAANNNLRSSDESNFESIAAGNNLELTGESRAGSLDAVRKSNDLESDSFELEDACASREFYFEHLRDSLQGIRTSLSWRLARPIRAKQISGAPDKTAAIRAILTPVRSTAKTSRRKSAVLDQW